MSMSAAEQLILVAEDDDDDRSLIQHAFKALSAPKPVRFVGVGVELLDYLHRRGAFTDRGANPAPALVFLDLNMPRLDGCATLDAIRHDPAGDACR
jgi:two-component system response regulator